MTVMIPSSNDLFVSKKAAIEQRTVSLVDCTFVDTRYLWSPANVADSPLPIYKYTIKASHKDFATLSSIVDDATSLVGREHYVFTPPDGWSQLTWQQQDEIRFTDQYNKTGVLPVYNPNTNQYLVPKAQDYVLSDAQYREVFCSSPRAPKLIGDVFDGEDLVGVDCSVRGSIRIFDNGRIYFSPREITVFSHNS